MTKICSKCKVERPIDDFYRRRRDSGIRMTRCKTCHDKIVSERNESNREERRATSKRWRDNNPDKTRAIWIKYNYGLTVTEYNQLLESGCEVCGSKENLHLDHDHNCCPGKRSCGECIRGVLCRNHNLAEGLIGSPEECIALAMYMMKNYDFLEVSKCES